VGCSRFMIFMNCFLFLISRTNVVIKDKARGEAKASPGVMQILRICVVVRLFVGRSLCERRVFNVIISKEAIQAKEKRRLLYILEIMRITRGINRNRMNTKLTRIIPHM
jgi:hypothetical protein